MVYLEMSWGHTKMIDESCKFFMRYCCLCLGTAGQDACRHSLERHHPLSKFSMCSLLWRHQVFFGYSIALSSPNGLQIIINQIKNLSFVSVFVKSPSQISRKKHCAHFSQTDCHWCCAPMLAGDVVHLEFFCFQLWTFKQLWLPCIHDEWLSGPLIYSKSHKNTTPASCYMRSGNHVMWRGQH